MTDYRPLRKYTTEERAQDRSDRKHLYNRDANERIKLSVRGNEEERRVIQIGENTSFANGKNGRERIDIDGAFSSIKSLQLDVIDGLRASIKQLAVENQKIQKERADFRLSVEKLRNDFENDYSSSLSTLRNIEKFVDEKITSSNELLQNQITNLQQSFLYKLNAFEENTINTIQSEQSRLGSELTKLTGRVDSVKLSQQGVSGEVEANYHLARELLTAYGQELGMRSGKIRDDQIRLSSGKTTPRLGSQSWTPENKDAEPMMEIDFRKFTLVRGIQILSELHPKFGVLAMAKEIVLEFIDQNGHPVLYNNGDLLIANTTCNDVELVSLHSPIRTNILRIYFKSAKIMQIQTEIMGNYIELGEVIHSESTSYQDNLLKEVKSVHELPKGYLSGIRARVSFPKGNNAVFNGFKLYCQFSQSKIGKRVYIGYIRTPKFENIWIESALQLPISGKKLIIVPEIDFDGCRKSRLHADFQFLGYLFAD